MRSKLLHAVDDVMRLGIVDFAGGPDERGQHCAADAAACDVEGVDAWLGQKAAETADKAIAMAREVASTIASVRVTP